MSNITLQVDGYIRKNKAWQKELQMLREIVLECGLVEAVKWRTPCYTFDEHNVAFIGAFKESCVLSFLKGALLKDAQALLEKPGANTQAARVIRLKDAEQIKALTPVLKAYVLEAIEIEKSGLKVEFKKTSDFAFPEEFQKKLDEDAKFKAAFEALTPGRQRGYLLYFSGAKQSKTRESRVEKYRAKILDGKGMDDE